MKNKYYLLIVFVLAILSICGLYNFFNPVKSIYDEKVIIEGTISKIIKEYEYNEASEYVEKYVAEILNKDKSEQVIIKLNNEEISKYKENDKVNFYEDKGEYYITEELATPTNGGVSWLVLAVCEIVAIVYILIKKVM